MRVFATTPPYHDYNWTVRGGMPPELVKKLTDAFLELDARNPRHAQILSLQRASRFIPTQPEYYGEIKRAARAADLLPTAAFAAEGPAIAAAAVLKFPLTEIANQFRQETGHQVQMTYGLSATFISQIENGAPFQMFLSTGESSVQRLATKGIAWDSGVVYAIGRVVLFAPFRSSLRVDPELKHLQAAVADGRIQRFAIADPARSPWGRAARAVLERAGLWDAIQPKLVVSETASQTMVNLAHGSSQAGIVPLSLASAQEIAKVGNFALIPADSTARSRSSSGWYCSRTPATSRPSSIATCRNRPRARFSSATASYYPASDGLVQRGSAASIARPACPLWVETGHSPRAHIHLIDCVRANR